MKTLYNICAECGKPTPESETQVIMTSKIIDGTYRHRIYFCSNCFTSVQSNPDVLKKHITEPKSKKNNNNNKQNGNNLR